MPTLPNMSLITPTLGGDSGTWDDKINACFGLIDAHDHTSGKGVQVPVSGLNINADFAMAGNAVTGLGSIAFNAVTALAAGSKRLFVSSADNELYWRTNAGTNVKLTSGTSINTTLVGGIVGDYSAVGAEVAFDDANKRYTFKDQSSPSKKWARLASGPVRIFEYNTTESVYVEHAVAAALAASYSVTWAAALPAGQVAVQIDNTGAVVYSNTFTSAITATDVKLSSARTRTIPLGQAQQTGGGGHVFNGSSWSLTTTSLATLYFPIDLDVGCRILSVTLKGTKASNGSNTLTFDLFKQSNGSGTSALDSATALTNAGAATGAFTFTQTLGTPVTLAAGQSLSMVISHNTNPASAADSVYEVYVTYDRP